MKKRLATLLTFIFLLTFTSSSLAQLGPMLGVLNMGAAILVVGQVSIITVVAATDDSADSN